MITGFAHSERGARHKEQNIEKQDCSRTVINFDGTYGIAAVADGHGGDKYIRSSKGASFAIDSAIENIENFLIETNYCEMIINKSNREIESKLRHLESAIINQWRESILKDLEEFPLSSHENSILDDENKIVCYGSTLIFACITNVF